MKELIAITLNFVINALFMPTISLSLTIRFLDGFSDA